MLRNAAFALLLAVSAFAQDRGAADDAILAALATPITPQPYSTSAEPLLRVELLRHDVPDAKAEELLAGLRERNGAPATTRGGDLAFVYGAQGIGGERAAALLARTAAGWHVAWTKKLRRRDLRWVGDPQGLPHRAMVTPEDLAVIDALLDAKKPAALENATLGYSGLHAVPSTAQVKQLRHEIEWRSEAPLFLGKTLELRHKIALVNSFDPQMKSLMTVSLPGYSKDHRFALVAWVTTVDSLNVGETLLEKANGQWTVSGDIAR